MPDVTTGEVAALVDVAAGDEAQIDGIQQLDQTSSRRLWNVANEVAANSRSSGVFR